MNPYRLLIYPAIFFIGCSQGSPQNVSSVLDANRSNMEILNPSTESMPKIDLSKKEKKPKTCDVPHTPNPIPKERQRPFVITVETFKDDAIVYFDIQSKLERYAGYNDTTQIYPKYTVDVEIDCDMDGFYEETELFICYFERKGLHKIAMRGEIPQIIFAIDNGSDDFDFKLISVDQWGDIRWKSTRTMLTGTDAIIRAKDKPDLRDVCDMDAMLASCENFNSPINDWDVSHVSSMISLFENSKSFNQPLEQWDTSNVVSMRYMFMNAQNFDQDLSAWDISSLEDASSIFGRCANPVICPKCDAFRQKIYDESQNRPQDHPLRTDPYLFRDKQAEITRTHPDCIDPLDTFGPP